jgi:hypothetical protein
VPRQISDKCIVEKSVEKVTEAQNLSETLLLRRCCYYANNPTLYPPAALGTPLGAALTMFRHTGIPLILSAGQRQSQLDAEDVADINTSRMLPGVAKSADHGVSSFHVGAGAGHASIDGGGRREFEDEVLGLLKDLKGDMMEMQTRMLRLEVQSRINQRRPEPPESPMDPKSRMHASHSHSPRDSVNSGTGAQPASESDVDESVVSSATDLVDPDSVYSYVTTPGTTPATTPVPTPIQTSRQPLSSQVLRQRNLERKRDEEPKSIADHTNRRGKVGGGRRGAGKGGSGEFPRRRDSIGSVESVDTQQTGSGRSIPERDTGIGRKASFSLNRQDTRELTKIAANAERRRSISVEASLATFAQAAARTTAAGKDQPMPLGGASSDLSTMQSSKAVSASGQGTSGLSSFVGVGSLVVGLGSLFKPGKSPSNGPPARKSAKHTFNAELEALCNIYKVRCYNIRHRHRRR